MFLANAVGNAGAYVSSAIWGTATTTSTTTTETKALSATSTKSGEQKGEVFQSPVTVPQLKAFAIESTKKMSEWAKDFLLIAQDKSDENEKMKLVQEELEKRYSSVWETQGIEGKVGSDALVNAGEILDAEDNDDIAGECQDALDALSAAMKDAVGTAVMGKEKLERAKAQIQAAQQQSQQAQQALISRMARMNPTQKKLFLKTVTSNGLAVIKQGNALPLAQQQAFFQELPQDKKDSFINYRLLVQMGVIKG